MIHAVSRPGAYEGDMMVSPRRIDKERLLGRSQLFSGLSPQVLSDLASLSITKHVSGGDTIFSEGDPGHSMMAIAEGAVRISAMTPSMRDVVLADLSKGDVLGEIALLDGGTRSAAAVALSNTVLIVLERRKFLDAMRRHPEIAEHVLGLLCARVRRADERMMDMGFLSLPARLSKVLLAATGPTSSASQKLSYSQSELADMVGSSRENLNRCLKRWQGEGFVNIKDGWIIVLDRAALEREGS